jgi:methyl-accepting chemotaxis protein
VRNLAMRAADAARNTAGLIEENINNIKGGSELVVKTDEAFSQVQTSAGKVGELVSEIAAASGEQAQGIDQVNKALTEMDKVTQKSAASAEESAAASEELSGQAEMLFGIVAQMRTLVGGAVDSKNQAAPREKRRKTTPKALPQAAPAPARPFPRPDEVIPLDDNYFNDF